jgi:hypothetical protein
MNDFSRLASQADNRALQVKDGELSKSGFFASEDKDARRKAISVFVSALCAEYGDHVASMISNTSICGLLDAGKPLTARLVQDLIKLAQVEKALVTEHNKKVVDHFLNGTEKNLDRAMARFCAKHDVTSSKDQTMLRDRVETFLSAKAEQGGFYETVLTAAALEENLARGLSKYTGFSYLHAEAVRESGTLLGTLHDRMTLADMGTDIGLDKKTNDDMAYYYRSVMDLDAMRRIQPEGDLSAETVYKALFKEDPPSGITGGKLVETIATRCKDEKIALVARLGEGNKNKAANLFQWGLRMPWEKIVSLVERPRTITLNDLPNMHIFFNKKSDPAIIARELLTDPPRVKTIGPNNTELPAPTYSFQYDDGKGGTKTESIQVSKNTNFSFGNEAGKTVEKDADKAAYLKMGENSLSTRLGELCREICGGEGATEEQVLKTMLCVGAGSRIPLKLVAALAGTTFTEHSNISVNLSRQPNGSILAKFSSPEDQKLQDLMGHFRMSLEITRDGEMVMSEFELTPPLEIRQQRDNEDQTEARLARISDARALAAPFRALDISQDGLFVQIINRAQTLDLEARLAPEFWRDLDSAIGARIEKMASESAVPLTEQQVLDLRKDVLDTFFNKLNQIADLVPPEQHGVFVRGCLELGFIPDETLLPAMQQMTGTVTRTFEAILAAENGHKAASLMIALSSSMHSVTTLNPDFAEKGVDLLPAQMLAMRMGVLNLMPNNTSEGFAEIFTQPSPFQDMLHILANDPSGKSLKASSDDIAFTLQSFSWFTSSMTGILSDNTVDRLNPYDIRERDLSLSRQREILGEGNYVVRGADIAMPGLAGLNQGLRDAMPILQGDIRDDAGKKLFEGDLVAELAKPARLVGDRTGFHRPVEELNRPMRIENRILGLRSQFASVYRERGIFVDGRYHHPSHTGTTLESFIALFPNSRVPEQLSNLATEDMRGLFLRHLGSAAPQKMYDLIWNNTFRRDLDGDHQVNMRIETLNADQGQYRLTRLYCNDPNNPDSSLDRYMYEVSVDVNLGAPTVHPDKRPLPTVEDVRLDFLIRGQEAVPGEA